MIRTQYILDISQNIESVQEETDIYITDKRKQLEAEGFTVVTTDVLEEFQKAMSLTIFNQLNRPDITTYPELVKSLALGNIDFISTDQSMLNPAMIGNVNVVISKVNFTLDEEENEEDPADDTDEDDEEEEEEDEEEDEEEYYVEEEEEEEEETESEESLEPELEATVATQEFTLSPEDSRPRQTE